MSKIICDAFFFTENEALKCTCACPIAVSASFQAALTPWLMTLAAERYSAFWSVDEVRSLALSPTFQFTRSLAIYLQNDNEQTQCMNSNLCSPIFSHLQELTLVYTSPTACCGLKNGEQAAEFVLKFKRLQNFRLGLDPSSDQTPPSEMITFFMRLLHSQSISQTLFVNVLKSFTIQMFTFFHKAPSEYAPLIKQHKIISFLVQKMVEFYRSDHGETLCVFLEAIRYSFIRSENESTELDSIDELVPMLDLIETIVINGDLHHPCFQRRDMLDPQEKKWYLSILVSQTLDACLHDANYSRLDFMRRYGRTLLPKLVDFVFSMYDGSKAAVNALSNCGPYFFARLMDDFYWTDEVESRTDSAGIRKMLDGGRQLLQHIPFDRIAFAIAEAVQVGTTNDLLSHVGIFLHCLTKYWKNDVLCSDEFRAFPERFHRRCHFTAETAQHWSSLC